MAQRGDRLGSADGSAPLPRDERLSKGGRLPSDGSERGLVRLFVYGSLQRGHENAHLLAHARFIARAQTAPGFRLVRYVEGFPALTRHEGSGAVPGELYELEEGELVGLDAFEECPDVYQREAVPLENGDLAFAYVIPSVVASGYPPLGTYLGRE